MNNQSEKKKIENIGGQARPPEPKEQLGIGGQAVIEGVMMRSRNYWAVAVRGPQDKIIVKDKRINSLANRYKIFKKPVFRGVLALIENLTIGLEALNISASISIGEDEQALSAFQLSVFFAFAFVLAIGLFVGVPFYLTKLTRSLIENRMVFTLVEGLIRISIFVGYIYLMSLLKDIRRVFSYHGAEHKVVNNFESEKPLSVENSKLFSTIHQRCGTNFVLIVFIVAIIVFSLLPTSSFLFRAGGKILLAPIIAGIAYEIIRGASKTQNKLVKAAIFPGLLLQKITTRKPDDGQLKVAMAALKRVLELEKENERQD